MALEPAAREEHKVLWVVCLASFLFFNSYGSINVAVPAIQKQFGSSLAAVQWVAMIGLVMVSSLSLCFGRAGDLLGRQRLYTVGVALYASGSGLAALAPSFPLLMLFRLVMTFGLAMAAPMSAGIVAARYPAHRRGEVLGWLAASIAVGRATGPTVGGSILQLWGWRGIFVANLIIGLAVSLTVFRVLREKEERRRERFDYWGAITLVVGYPSFLVALSLAANSGWASPQIRVWLALSAVGSLGFLFAELRAERPLIQPGFFKSIPLSATVVSLALISAVHYPVFILAPLYMQNVLGLAPLIVGLAATSLPVCTALISPVGGRLADRTDSCLVAAAGVFLTLGGIALYSRMGMGSHYLSVVPALGLMGVGIGLFIPANQRTAFSAVGAEHYGVISAVISSLAPAAGTVGTALAVALLEGSIAGKSIQDPVAFSHAQQSAFTSLLPFAAVAVMISVLGRWKRKGNGS